MSDWDPTPDQRTYYRSAEDGQRAYLVKRNGKDMVRLDRPMEEILRPLDGSWRPDTQTYPFTAHQVAEVAFAADRAVAERRAFRGAADDADVQGHGNSAAT